MNMINQLKFEESTTQTLFRQEEFNQFKRMVTDVAEKYPDITGILLTGSLCQRQDIHKVMPCFDKSNLLLNAYMNIAYRCKRKSGPGVNSDLDMWLCTKEPIFGEDVKRYLNKETVSLLQWYSKREKLAVGEWIDKKHEAYDGYYKCDDLYSTRWSDQNGGDPSSAIGFKKELVSKLEKDMPSFLKRVEKGFTKNVYGDFIEARAFPPCVFNLRPEKLMNAGISDRTPFGYYLPDWVNPVMNCQTLYIEGNNSSRLPYPFNPLGNIPGAYILKRIKEIGGGNQNEIK
jgi:hypothetical protein